MSRKRSQSDIVRALVLHGNSAERESLLKRIARAERDEYSCRCALILVLVLALISLSAVCYSAVLLPDVFQGTSHRVIRFFCGLGLASLLSAAAFLGCWLWYRGVLNRLHDETRHVVLSVLETQSKQVRASAGPLPGVSIFQPGEEPASAAGTAVHSGSGYLDLFHLGKAR